MIIFFTHNILSSSGFQVSNQGELESKIVDTISFARGIASAYEADFSFFLQISNKMKNTDIYSDSLRRRFDVISYPA